MAEPTVPGMLRAADARRTSFAPPPAASPSDEDLVAAALAGEAAAFPQLVERWWQPVRRSVWRIVGQPEDAEDLTQEAFLRAYAALSHFDPQYRFGGWITRIATNLALNFRRRRGREAFAGETIDEADAFFERTPDDGDASPERLAADHELAARLWQAVEALPDDHRVVVVLRHVVELSYDEIAATLDLPMGTVKSRLARARRMLKGSMER